MLVFKRDKNGKTIKGAILDICDQIKVGAL